MTAQVDTKERILDAAEALFAEHGFSHTSMRAITAHASVNLAAINYHFGSKTTLVRTVFERRLMPMNQARIRLLTQLEQQYGADIPLAAVIEAFIRPALALSRGKQDGGARFIKLLGQSYTKPSNEVQGFVRAMHEDVIERFKVAFSRALPQLSKSDLYWRLHFMVGLLAYCMAGTDMMRLIASCNICDPEDIEGLTQRLVGFLLAGLSAPDTLPYTAPRVQAQA